MAAVLNRARLMGVMAERGWGQGDLAKAAGMAQSTVSRLLGGLMEPSGPAIGRLLDATGLHYDELFTSDLVLAERYLSTRDVAERLNTSTKYVQRLVLRGELSAIKLGSSRVAPLRFTETELSRFMSAQRHSSAS